MEGRCLEWLFVVRHQREEEKIRETSSQLPKTLADLRRTDPDWNVRVARVLYSDANDGRVVLAAELLAWATGVAAAEWMPDADGDEPPSERPNLGPPQIGPHPTETTSLSIDNLASFVDRQLESAHKDGKNALVLVGNQPAVDWFLSGRVDTHIAVMPAEIVCLVRERGSKRRWHLWWTLAPSNPDVTNALRTKVQSKMTVLSVLAGFGLALLGAMLIGAGDPAHDRRLVLGAAGLQAAAVALWVGALLVYDQLLMPTRFWTAVRPRKPSHSLGPRRWLRRRTPWRPPSSSDLIVYLHMIRTWRWVVAGLFASFASIAVLGSAVIDDDDALPIVGGAAIALAGLYAAWWLTHRPRLGTED